jgi:hypothetical protein
MILGFKEAETVEQLSDLVFAKVVKNESFTPEERTAVLGPVHQIFPPQPHKH